MRTSLNKGEGVLRLRGKKAKGSHHYRGKIKDYGESCREGRTNTECSAKCNFSQGVRTI